MRLLVCTDGSARSLPALSYCRWLAPLLRCPVTVLGIQECDRSEPLLKRAVDETAGRLAEHGVQVECRYVRGRAEQVIPQAASEGTLTVLGPFERPGTTASRDRTLRPPAGSVGDTIALRARGHPAPGARSRVQRRQRIR